MQIIQKYFPDLSEKQVQQFSDLQQLYKHWNARINVISRKNIDKLYVKEATVGKSMVLKRFRPRARGRAGKILKPFSRIKIQLTEKNLEEKVVQSEKEPNQEKVENGTKN